MTMLKQTKPTVAVLKAFLDANGRSESLWGYRICQISSCSPGTIYSVLARLERSGLLMSYAEPGKVRGRPSRKMWMLTEFGVRQAQEVLEDQLAAGSSTTRSKAIA